MPSHPCDPHDVFFCEPGVKQQMRLEGHEFCVTGAVQQYEPVTDPSGEDDGEGVYGYVKVAGHVAQSASASASSRDPANASRRAGAGCFKLQNRLSVMVLRAGAHGSSVTLIDGKALDHGGSRK